MSTGILMFPLSLVNVLFQFLNLETSAAMTSTPVSTKERQALFSANKLVPLSCLLLMTNLHIEIKVIVSFLNVLDVVDFHY